MGRFLFLMVLFTMGCMTASEENCPDPETVAVRDTITQVERDTISSRDTVKVIQRDTIHQLDTVQIQDTIRILDTLTIVLKDTVVIRDTVKILANATQPDELLGIWEGASGSQKVTLAFNSSILNEADFSATLGSTSGSGYISTLENGQAKVIHAGFKDVTWLLSLQDGVLTIEEIGIKFFAGHITVLKKR